MTSKPRTNRRRRILLIACPAIASMVLAYTLAGFVVVPWIAKRELPRIVQEQIHLQAHVGDIALNPFTLTLRVNDFVLAENDGRPLLGFRQAVVDLEWRSFLRRAWVLSEARLTEPAAHIEISKEGRLNLAALLARPKTGATRSEPVRFAIAHAAIDDGRVEFEDRREGYKNRIEHLSLELSSLSTLAADRGPYALVGQTPDGATLRWKGDLSLQPLAATGTLALEHGALPQLNPYLDNFVAAHITAGRADLQLPYRFTIADGKPRLDIEGAKLVLQDFALAAPGAEAPLAKLGRLALEGIKLDLPAHRAFAQALRIADFSLTANRNAAGDLDLARIFIKRETDDGSSPWQANIAQVELTDGSVSLADRGSAVALSLEHIGARLTDVSSDLAQPVTFDLAAGIGGGGKIVARGRATPATGALEARVEASTIPLAPLQPLLARYADVKLASGELSLAGDVRAGERGPKLAYAGSATMANVAIQDDASAQLLSWKSLTTKTLRLTLSPNRAEIDELRWSAPAGKLAIAADRTTNIGRAFRRKGASASAAPANEGKTEATSGFSVAVRRIRVEQGALDFSDETISPGFATSIRDLAGTANGVSSDRNTRSQFTLEGRVDEYGFARLAGTLNPFEPRDRTNFRVEFRNLDVTKVSPYTVKFAGYRVASGRMSLDLNYRVRENLLEGDNKIVLEQFTLGKRVESPTALKLPLELAVALLKDANGVIDIAVPISGRLDDPQFDYGALIWKAIGNLVTNIVAAPFRALGRLFGGGGEELAAIAFEPGSSRLLPPEREKLKRIVEALAKRPELKLVIPARYDAQVDARALKRGALRRDIATRAGFDVTDEDPPGPVSIEDRRTRDALRALFAERFSDAELDRVKKEAEEKARKNAESGKQQQNISVLERLRKFARGEPQVADASDFYRTLARRLIDEQPLADSALDELAQKRATAVAAALKEAGVDADRISQSKAEPTSNADARQVTLQLALAPMR